MRYLIAGYGLPVEIGITALFGMGVPPESISVLTHELDERNKGLYALLNLREIRYSFDDPKSNSVHQWVADFNPDYIISLHYRKKIPDTILKLARFATLNLHPSLLPNYRGTNSVAWAIINGEKHTGYTFHRMNADFDTGRIIFQEVIKIDSNETAFSLFNKQIYKAMSNFEKVLKIMASGYEGSEQPVGGNYFKRQLPFDGIIDHDWPDDMKERFIRAMIFPPFKPAKCFFNENEYFITSFQEYKELLNKTITTE